MFQERLEQVPVQGEKHPNFLYLVQEEPSNEQIAM
jgi:hypothetical protein